MMTVAVTVIVAVIVVMAVLVVARLIFGGLDEIHRALAGVVLMAVLVPVLGVPRGHVQVDRLDGHCADHYRGGLRDHWLRIHHRRRRCVTELHLTVHARYYLAADRRVETDILC